MPSKYEKEISEILERMDRQSPADRDWQKRDREHWKKPKTPRNNRPSGFSVSPGLLLWVGVGLVVIAFVVNMVLPVAAPLIALVGIGLFFASIVLSVMGRTGKTEKYWRGQPVKPRKQYGGLGGWWRDFQRRWFRKG